MQINMVTQISLGEILILLDEVQHMACARSCGTEKEERARVQRACATDIFRLLKKKKKGVSSCALNQTHVKIVIVPPLFPPFVDSSFVCTICMSFEKGSVSK